MFKEAWQLRVKGKIEQKSEAMIHMDGQVKFDPLKKHTLNQSDRHARWRKHNISAGKLQLHLSHVEKNT